MDDATKKWIGWAVVGFFILGGIARRHFTAKDMAREASGQQAIPIDSSEEEKQGVALVSSELQAEKLFESRRDVWMKSDTFAHLNAADSMKNPIVAHQSLSAITDMCAASKELRSSLASIYLRINETMPASTVKEYDTRVEWCTAEVNLYQFASNPALGIRMDPVDGNLVFRTKADMDAFRIRRTAAEESREQFIQAAAISKAAGAKLMKELGVTDSDYGVQKNQ